MRGKLNELWALVGAVTAAKDRDRKGGSVEWAVVDDEGLAQIAQVSFTSFCSSASVSGSPVLLDPCGRASRSGSSNENTTT